MPVAREVIARLPLPKAPPEKTVDGLLAGDPKTSIKGIGAAFMATYNVLQEAARRGLNFLIVHEGLYYRHQKSAEVWPDDPISQKKRQFIAEHGLVLYRCHDGIHRMHPDGITEGLLRALEWTKEAEKRLPEATVIQLLDQISLVELVKTIKKRLDLPYVRVIGQESMRCRRLALFAGYRGGAEQAIPLLAREGVDVLICGEAPEWETPEYVRDAIEQHKTKAFIAIGHAESEVPGMQMLAQQLQRTFPRIPVCFLAEKPLYRIF